MLTDQFDEFNDKLEQSCDWYLFPHEVQKMYAIILVNAQQSTHLESYANIICTRETMKTVNESGLLEAFQIYFSLFLFLLRPSAQVSPILQRFGNLFKEKLGNRA